MSQLLHSDQSESFVYNKKMTIARLNFRFFCTKVARNDLQKQEKLVKVAVIGVPNAGKSTLINELVEKRLCPVSRKVHTTRKFSQSIAIRGTTQIIFFDTPGLITDREVKKHRLESSFLTAYRHSIQHADLIGVMHDVSNSFTRESLHPSVIDALKEYSHMPSFLILNKIDALKSKRVLLDLVKTLTNGCLNGKPYGDTKFNLKRGKMVNLPVEAPIPKPNCWSNFEQVFMVSALNGDGIPGLMNWVATKGKEAPWMFPEDKFTDQTPEDLIVQTVQARLLDFLPQEIPYQCQARLEFYDTDKGQIFTSVLVTCPNERLEKLLCGVGNGKLKQITESCTSDLIETFQVPISLTISTMVLKEKEKS